jgi:hypothetical protein
MPRDRPARREAQVLEAAEEILSEKVGAGLGHWEQENLSTRRTRRTRRKTKEMLEFGASAPRAPGEASIDLEACLFRLSFDAFVPLRVLRVLPVESG